MTTFAFTFIDEAMSDADKNLLTPRRQSDLASGFDLASSHKETVEIGPQQRMLIATGIALALPAGFEGQVRSRSGLALKQGVCVLNAPGTIDADYRGEVKVILMNLSAEPFIVSFGMRIAQLVICPVSMAPLTYTLTLSQSERGAQGFGSTGLAAN